MASAAEEMGVEWKFVGTRKRDHIRWLDWKSFKEEVPWGVGPEGWEGFSKDLEEDFVGRHTLGAVFHCPSDCQGATEGRGGRQSDEYQGRGHPRV